LLLGTPMKINALYAGKPQPFGPRGAPSSIIKSPVESITVESDHTHEDEQGNKKLHGGSEKVLHQYSYAGYAALQEAYPDVTFDAGSIGENILVDGMTDESVCIGDIYRFGEVELEVSAPRAPCNKISHRFDVKNLDRYVGEHGITGWYFRVKKTGTLHIGDTVECTYRHDHTVSVGDLMRCVFNKDAKQAAVLTGLVVLDDEWREKCQRVVRQG